MKNIVCLISILMISFLMMQLGKAQEKKVESTAVTKSKKEVSDSLKILMQQHRNKEIITIRDNDILGGEANEVLELLEPYEKDTSSSVRWSAYAFTFQIGKSHKDLNIRRKAVARLIKGLSDSDPLVWQSTGKHLLDFNSADFENATKAVIHQLFITGKPERMNYIIRVIGAADMKDEMDKLGELLIDESKYKQMWWGTDTIGWAARLARARLGNKADVTRAIERVESVPDNDIRVVVLLKHIAYIRQPEAIEILKKYLDSEDSTSSTDGIDVRPVKYAQTAISLLADSIDNFPVKREAGSYSKSDIELARKWMSNKSNWINSIRR